MGTTVLMATHNQEIVNAMRRRVLALEHGTLVRDESGAAYEREY
jgi:cell division transport system ATP-binding protein